MSERKVLNKYYPPDFDPSKIPKLKLPKDRQYVVRLMAPFNMRCKTCGEYIYKGKKFNARKETVQNESYLGLPIFRFYIKCTRCLAEITFKTDPENTDYAMEHGATRNFQAEKLLEEEEERLQKEREDEEMNNPMKVLENRTKDSKLEMEVLENLQELKELNQRQAHVDFESMLQQYKDLEERQREQEAVEDESEMKAMLEEAQGRRLLEDSDSDEDQPQGPAKSVLKSKPTDILQEDSAPQAKKLKVEAWEKSIGKLSGKVSLSGLVTTKRKPDTSVANGVGTQNVPLGTGEVPRARVHPSPRGISPSLPARDPARAVRRSAFWVRILTAKTAAATDRQRRHRRAALDLSLTFCGFVASFVAAAAILEAGPDGPRSFRGRQFFRKDSSLLLLFPLG